MPDQRDPERVCLFGGTFDPIHIAHLRIANEALKTFALSRVLFVPAGNPPHKDTAVLTPFEDRFHMIEIACAPYPSFVPSSLEAGSETSYTVDTLERVRKDLLPGDELFFLIGADAFAELKTWKRWEDVTGLTDFIVVSRPGEDYVVPEGARVRRLEGLDLPVSSSLIRSRLASGEMVAEVPAEVRDYIAQRGLYGAERVTAAT
ncbi:MAG: nicotinate-nucleotide adenylyltransferase [Acidobacteriota bacterium]|nr:nicotinate-nucleotide adenylyltransferase [Acidobacteriota bacterium]